MGGLIFSYISYNSERDWQPEVSESDLSGLKMNCNPILTEFLYGKPSPCQDFTIKDSIWFTIFTQLLCGYNGKSNHIPYGLSSIGAWQVCSRDLLLGRQCVSETSSSA